MLPIELVHRLIGLFAAFGGEFAISIDVVQLRAPLPTGGSPDTPATDA